MSELFETGVSPMELGSKLAHPMVLAALEMVPWETAFMDLANATLAPMPSSVATMLSSKMGSLTPVLRFAAYYMLGRLTTGGDAGETRVDFDPQILQVQNADPLEPKVRLWFQMSDQSLTSGNNGGAGEALLRMKADIDTWPSVGAAHSVSDLQFVIAHFLDLLIDVEIEASSRLLSETAVRERLKLLAAEQAQQEKVDSMPAMTDAAYQNFLASCETQSEASEDGMCRVAIDADRERAADRLRDKAKDLKVVSNEKYFLALMQEMDQLGEPRLQILGSHGDSYKSMLFGWELPVDSNGTVAKPESVVQRERDLLPDIGKLECMRILSNAINWMRDTFPNSLTTNFLGIHTGDVVLLEQRKLKHITASAGLCLLYAAYKTCGLLGLEYNKGNRAIFEDMRAVALNKKIPFFLRMRILRDTANLAKRQREAASAGSVSFSEIIGSALRHASSFWTRMGSLVHDLTVPSARDASRAATGQSPARFSFLRSAGVVMFGVMMLSHAPGVAAASTPRSTTRYLNSFTPEPTVTNLVYPEDILTSIVIKNQGLTQKAFEIYDRDTNLYMNTQISSFAPIAKKVPALARDLAAVLIATDEAIRYSDANGPILPDPGIDTFARTRAKNIVENVATRLNVSIDLNTEIMNGLRISQVGAKIADVMDIHETFDVPMIMSTFFMRAEAKAANPEASKPIFKMIEEFLTKGFSTSEEQQTNAKLQQEKAELDAAVKEFKAMKLDLEKTFDELKKTNADIKKMENGFFTGLAASVGVVPQDLIEKKQTSTRLTAELEKLNRIRARINQYPQVVEDMLTSSADRLYDLKQHQELWVCIAIGLSVSILFEAFSYIVKRHKVKVEQATVKNVQDSVDSGQSSKLKQPSVESIASQRIIDSSELFD